MSDELPGSTPILSLIFKIISSDVKYRMGFLAKSLRSPARNDYVAYAKSQPKPHHFGEIKPESHRMDGDAAVGGGAYVVVWGNFPA